MRLPSVTIARAFAFGIAIGLRPGVAQHESSPAFLRVALLSAVLRTTSAAFLSARNCLSSAAILSLSAWIVLERAAPSITAVRIPPLWIFLLQFSHDSQ